MPVADATDTEGATGVVGTGIGTEKSVPPPDQQGAAVHAAWHATLAKGETWYLIDAKWWRNFCAFAGLDPVQGTRVEATGTSVPGQIDNSTLQRTAQDLKMGLQEGLDFAIVHQDVWNLVHGWYGGGPVFDRKVVTFGLLEETRLEMFPVFVTCVWLDEKGEPDPSSQHIRRFSREDTLALVTSAIQADVLQETDEKLSDEAEPVVRLWLPVKDIGDESSDAQEEGAADPSADGEPPARKNVVVKGSLKQRTLDDLKLDLEDIVWLEKKHDGSWVRSTVKENWKDFQVGDIVDAKDTVGKWYESKILQVDEGKRKIRVHYIGWGEQYDDWVDMDDETAVQKQGTHTDGPYEPSARASFDGYYNRGWRSSEEGAPPIRGAVGLRNLGNTCFMNSTLQCLSHTPLLTDYFLKGCHTEDINRDNPLGWQGRVADEYAAFLKEVWGGKFKIVAPTALKSALGEVAPRFSGYSQQDSQELLSFLLDGLHEDLNRVTKKPPTTTVESKGRPDAEVADEAWNTHLLRNKSIIVDYLQGQLKSRLVCPDCKRVSITFDPFTYLSVPIPQASDNAVTVTFVPADPTRRLMRLTVMLPSLGHIAELKTAVAEVTGAKPNHLVVGDIWHGKVHSLLQDDDGLNRIRPADDIFVYELPDVDSVPIRYLKVVTAYHTDSSSRTVEAFGLPLLVVVTTERKMTASELLSKVVAAAKRHTVSSTGASLPFSVKLRRWNSQVDVEDDDAEIDLDSRYASRLELECDWHDKSAFNEESLEREDHESVVAGSDKGADGAGAATAADLSVYSCLRSFTQEETLSEQDPWYCSVCRKHQQATKKFDLWKLPEILIVHLKRFKHTRWFREKIDSVVQFPLNESLDMASFTVNPEEKKNSLYDLYAVSNHMGGLGGGHYTAYVKNLTTQEWWLHDDSSVRPVGDDLTRIVSSNAYVLFFKRKGTTAALPVAAP